MCPKGPFGFPRMTSIGPMVEDSIRDKDPAELYQEMTLRPHSYRNYSPEEFHYLMDQEFDPVKVRELFSSIEGSRKGGRLENAVEKTYKFFGPLDEDERQFWSDRNPGMMEWLNVWARAQDLRQFREYER